MSDKTRFWFLLAILIASIALAVFLNSSYSDVLGQSKAPTIFRGYFERSAVTPRQQT